MNNNIKLQILSYVTVHVSVSFLSFAPLVCFSFYLFTSNFVHLYATPISVCLIILFPIPMVCLAVLLPVSMRGTHKKVEQGTLTEGKGSVQLTSSLR